MGKQERKKMPDLKIKPNIDNGDLPKQLEFDFNKKDLEPIPFGQDQLTFIDMLNLVKFTELLEGNKKE